MRFIILITAAISVLASVSQSASALPVQDSHGEPSQLSKRQAGLVPGGGLGPLGFLSNRGTLGDTIIGTIVGGVPLDASRGPSDAPDAPRDASRDDDLDDVDPDYAVFYDN